MFQGLARDYQRLVAEGFPDFDACSPARFPAGLPIKSQLLYQLSYRPVCRNKLHKARRRCQTVVRCAYRTMRSAGSCLSTTGRAGAFASSEARMKTVRVMFSIFW